MLLLTIEKKNLKSCTAYNISTLLHGLSTSVVNYQVGIATV